MRIAVGTGPRIPQPLAKMKPLCFSCTQCGKCCSNTFLPLTVEEGILWTQNGGAVGLCASLVEWAEADTALFGHQWVRSNSVIARCGKAKIAAMFHLHGIVSGACHHLAGSLCANYEHRPTVCRVYPVDLNDPIDVWPVERHTKECPPDAWQGEPLAMGTRILETRPERAMVQAFQEQHVRDLPALDHLRLMMDLKVGMGPLTGVCILPLPASEAVSMLQEAQRRAGEGMERSIGWWRLYEPDAMRAKQMKRDGFLMAGSKDLSPTMIVANARPS